MVILNTGQRHTPSLAPAGVSVALVGCLRPRLPKQPRPIDRALCAASVARGRAAAPVAVRRW